MGKGLINSYRLIISPSGCFMKRQQLVWLFLSLSGCSAQMIPGIDWRNLLFFISLSPVLHLIYQSRRTGGSWRFHIKIYTFRTQVWHISQREKGDTYATSTHFPCFLQNWFNCKPVLYLRNPPTSHHSLSSNGYSGHAVLHRKTRCVFFKPWGSNLSQFFRIQFEVVRLELLAPICKREKKRPMSSFSWRCPSLL